MCDDDTWASDQEVDGATATPMLGTEQHLSRAVLVRQRAKVKDSGAGPRAVVCPWQTSTNGQMSTTHSDRLITVIGTAARHPFKRSSRNQNNNNDDDNEKTATTKTHAPTCRCAARRGLLGRARVGEEGLARAVNERGGAPVEVGQRGRGHIRQHAGKKRKLLRRHGGDGGGSRRELLAGWSRAPCFTRPARADQQQRRRVP